MPFKIPAAVYLCLDAGEISIGRLLDWFRQRWRFSFIAEVRPRIWFLSDIGSSGIMP